MKQRPHIKKIFIAMALGATLCLSPLVSSPADAHEGCDVDYVYTNEDTDTTNPNIKHFKYDYFSGKDFYPDYEKVWRAMQPTFKGTHNDQDTKFPNNPLIGIAEFDLNNDDSPETIAFPIEDAVFDYALCGQEMLCPHYIIKSDEAQLIVLGVIRAFAVDRGDEIKNGYWTLKAFTKQTDPENFSYFELYAFDTASKQYQRLEP
jgi:hypothetical protein